MKTFDSSFIGWRIEVEDTQLRLSKWGYPDRTWVFPLGNYVDMPTSELPARLVFDETSESARRRVKA